MFVLSGGEFGGIEEEDTVCAIGESFFKVDENGHKHFYRRDAQTYAVFTGVEPPN